jgi:hypothetical protein
MKMLTTNPAFKTTSYRMPREAQVSDSPMWDREVIRALVARMNSEPSRRKRSLIVPITSLLWAVTTVAESTVKDEMLKEFRRLREPPWMAPPEK